MKKLLLILSFAFCLLPFHLKAQWVQQTVPVSKPIQGIKFIDTLKGWACTGNTGSPNEGYVLHTTNGGANWFVQLTVPSTSFSSICVIDSNIIYAGGSDGNGQLFKSTNGGTNWTNLGSPSGIYDMVFTSKDSGYYSSYNIGADVRTTTNGGLNWTARISGITQQTQRIFFLNYNAGYCGANTRLYKTTDAGMNWILNNTFTNPLQSVFFLNINTGWAGISTVFYTSNGGVNWITQTVPPNSNSPISNISFLNNNTGYAGTGFNRILKTTNSGVNWGYQILPIFNGSVISIVDSMNGWCGGTSDEICRTTNGGGVLLEVKLISNEVPKTFKLYQNYPNPFNPTTSIKYQIINSKYVLLKIYDILGKEIETLVNQKQKTGTYQIDWNSGNNPSGIYFYKLIVEGNIIETKKMILLK